ncbi:MAG: tRNA 2-thiouridine(34) synthase MnmA [Chloroflexota bacterium]|nr:tRNA 2-thiouridine(34) synthase MnmA [Chloroflexota bacterium]
MTNRKVVVAMSGGVDSSLTAALLMEQGYEVIGVHMRLHHLHAQSKETGASGKLNKGCCSADDVDDARMVCYELGVPFYVLDFEGDFRKTVIDNFISEYSRGRTPYPCLMCNRYVKFDSLLKRAAQLGADHLATGHYGRITYDETANRYALRRALDPTKDQSYVLYHLGQDELSKLLLPLGEHAKTHVREMSAERNLVTADKPDSQEICFIPSNNYRGFLEKVSPGMARPGAMLDTAGRAVGTHTGVPNYTIGQRKGLGALGAQPYFVTELRPEENVVVVGTDSDLRSDALTADDMHWTSGQAPAEPFRANVKIRYRAAEVPATVSPLDGRRIRVEFDTPQRAVTPGQAAVIYMDDRVIGGGTIERRGMDSVPEHGPC